MNALEREVRAFLARHQVSQEDRVGEGVETLLRYTELDALRAAVDATAREVGPMPSWLFGREPNR